MDGEYFHHILRQLTLLVKSSSASILREVAGKLWSGWILEIFVYSGYCNKLGKMKAKSYLNVVDCLVLPSEWVGGDSLCIASLFCLPRGRKKILSLE